MIYREKHPDVHQEPDKVPLGRILLVAFAALGICAALTVASSMLLDSDLAELRPSGEWPEAERQRREYPIILQDLFSDVGPGQSMQQRQTAPLRSFRWVDRQNGRVGLPIDVAMDLVVEESRR